MKSSLRKKTKKTHFKLSLKKETKKKTDQPTLQKKEETTLTD